MIIQRLKQVQSWRWRKEKTQKVKEWLKSFSPQELKALFLILVGRKTSEIREVFKLLSGKNLNELFKLLKKEGLEELENLFQKQKFAQLILERKFKEENVQFPSIILSVRSGGPEKPHRINLRFKKYVIHAYLAKKNFPLGSQVVVSPKRFDKFYGWTFQIVQKENPLVQSGERIVKEIKTKIFSLVNFDVSQIQRKLLGRFLSGKKVFPPSFVHIYKQTTRFSVYPKRKRRTINLNRYCKDGEKIEVIPVRTSKGDFLEFYKITETMSEERKLLKRYQMTQKFPYFTLLYQAQK